MALLAGGQAAAAPPAARWLDVLDMHGMPASPTDRSFNIFFDAGAWHGYSLPPADDGGTGFIGPFVHSLGEGQWTGRRFALLELKDAARLRAITLAPIASHAGPGYLLRRFAAPDVRVEQTLYFADARHALVRIKVMANRAIDIDVAVSGQLMAGRAASLAEQDGAVLQRLAPSASMLYTSLRMDDSAGGPVTLSGADYRIALGRALHLAAGQVATIYVDQQLIDNPSVQAPQPVDEARAWQLNRKRWNGYLASIASSHLAGLPNDVAQHVALKAVVTLLGNWRAARGDLHHDGVIPSYSNPDFNGFWAWDAWKHAVALAAFAPQLAREQVRALFDYQAADGMLPDCIYLDRANDNWRNSKPPLASWAVLAVYRATGDRAFLAEMYPKLVRYHRWWYSHRDHERTGLAQYGSTDGTTVAAKWESGMDNAVRFDGVGMLRNGPGAWSMNQISVDLNAYLYLEKKELAEIAGMLGKTAEAQQWLSEAAGLRKAIQVRMYDRRRGYFFDARLGGNELVRVYGSEGWAPLWAGVASDEQAMRAIGVMLDAQRFATYLPFPSLARDDPRFSPIDGYWRGPLWLDQAYFAVAALRRYGHARQADEMAYRLVTRAAGLTRQAPMYENYDPLTGKPYQSANFSWTAASYLLLLANPI
jgi:putative isomerase